MQKGAFRVIAKENTKTYEGFEVFYEDEVYIPLTRIVRVETSNNYFAKMSYSEKSRVEALHGYMDDEETVPCRCPTRTMAGCLEELGLYRIIISDDANINWTYIIHPCEVDHMKIYLNGTTKEEQESHNKKHKSE